jgi:DHA2 family methylenomycin A resistance protein-like MFS transporter
MFLVLLDVTIVNVALPAIRRGLGADGAGLEWVVDADTLGFAALMLTAGTLGDRFGRRRLALAGLVVFGVGSAVCALAGDLGVLLSGRALQGVGGALLLPQTLAIIADEYPEPGEQARAIGVWAAVSSLALPAGPLLGGVLVDRYGWPSVFAINVPVVVAAAVVAVLTVREVPRRRRRRVDLGGQLLVVVGLAALTGGLVEVNRLGLGAPVVGLVVAGVLALALFVVVESRVRDPLLPVPWLRRPAFVGPNAVGLLMNFGGVGMLYLVTLFLQVTQHRSPLAAGLWLIAFTLPLAAFAPPAGRLAARVGPRVPMTVGMTLAAAGVALFAALDRHAGAALLVPAMALTGTGLALNTAPMVAAVMRALPASEGAFASGANNTARQVGAAIGVALLGAVAGDPGGSGFVSGVRVAAIVTAVVWVGAAIVASRVGRSIEAVPALSEEPVAGSDAA